MEVGGGHAPPTAATLGLGHGHRPAGDLLPHRPVRAGRPADRPRRAARSMWETWDDFLAIGEQYLKNAPKGVVVHRQRRRASTTRSSASPRSSTTTRTATRSTTRTRPSRTPGTSPSRPIEDGLTRQARAVRPGLEPGVRQRRLRHHRLPRVDDRLHQGPGRRRRRRQVGRRQHPRRRRQLGRLVPLHPGRQREPGGGVRADQVADRPRAAGQDVDERRSTSRRARPPRRIRSVAAATDDYFSGAPIGEIFKESADDLPDRDPRPEGRRRQGPISQRRSPVDQQGQDPDEAWQQTLDEIANAIE